MARLPSLLLLAALAACGDTEPQASTPSAPPVPDDPRLAFGRGIWMDACRGCHEIGVADAPKLGDRDAWAPRIAQGRAVLHAHALEGFFGAKGTMMPPRGGNPALSDDEVRAAVDYMVAASSP